MPADSNDRTDFENADRGFIASIAPTSPWSPPEEGLRQGPWGSEPPATS